MSTNRDNIFRSCEKLNINTQDIYGFDEFFAAAVFSHAVTYQLVTSDLKTKPNVPKSTVKRLVEMCTDDIWYCITQNYGARFYIIMNNKLGIITLYD